MSEHGPTAQDAARDGLLFLISNLERNGLLDHWSADTARRFVLDLAAATSRIAELEQALDTAATLLEDGDALARNIDHAVSSARVAELTAQNAALVAALTHCLTTVHVLGSPCQKCWNYFPLINCEPCRAGNHVKCRLDACPCICPPDQQPEDVCKENRALLSQQPVDR